jgi:hypothetical protein
MFIAWKTYPAAAASIRRNAIGVAAGQQGVMG